MRNPENTVTERLPSAEARGVLVVDDDDDVRPILCFYVKALGFRPFPAASGAEAVEVLHLHASEVGAALVDLHMRGLSGLRTVAALRSQKPQLPCCLVSGDLITPELLQTAGVQCVLEKPFTREAVAVCLRNFWA